MGQRWIPTRQYKTSEIAEGFRVSQETVCDWINGGHLKGKAIKLSAGYRVLGKFLNELEEKRKR
jgi:predicted XRE-type DNA-binding protein